MQPSGTARNRHAPDTRRTSAPTDGPVIGARLRKDAGGPPAGERTRSADAELADLLETAEFDTVLPPAVLATLAAILSELYGVQDAAEEIG